MLDSIDKELQLFIVALDKTEDAILSRGGEMGFLLERIASLKQCYEQGKIILDLLRKQAASET